MNWEIQESNQEFREGSGGFRGRSIMPLKTKLMLIGGLIGGIAIGTFLFLFFLAVFLYIFIPVAAILLLSSLAKRYFKR